MFFIHLRQKSTYLLSKSLYSFCILTITNLILLNACTAPSPSPSTIEILDCPNNKHNNQPTISLQNYTYTKGKMVFSPQNVRLGSQRLGGSLQGIKKGSQGVHLHVSVNNQQHELKNHNIFDYPLEDGSYNLFAFVGNSYGVSFKQTNAILGKKITIQNGQLVSSQPFEQIALLYNMPIGTYEITPTDSILLDFVLYSTSLQEQGNYITVTINEQAPLKIYQWQPYYLTGFHEGSHKIVLSLHNAQDKQIAPPVAQTIVVKPPKDKLQLQ